MNNLIEVKGTEEQFKQIVSYCLDNNIPILYGVKLEVKEEDEWESSDEWDDSGC